MSQLLSILAFAFSFFVCSAIYTIVYRRRQKKAKEELAADKPMLDDTSYIQEVQHLSGQVGFVVWQQYDILNRTRPRLQPEQSGAEKLRQAERRIWFAEHCRT